jgi:hypothetical protein
MSNISFIVEFRLSFPFPCLQKFDQGNLVPCSIYYIVTCYLQVHRGQSTISEESISPDPLGTSRRLPTERGGGYFLSSQKNAPKWSPFKYHSFEFLKQDNEFKTRLNMLIYGQYTRMLYWLILKCNMWSIKSNLCKH